VYPLSFWLQLETFDQEIIIQAEHVANTILPAAEHEAGHLVAAHYLGAEVVGIAIGFMPGSPSSEMTLHAIYGWAQSSTEAECIVKAAGPAADILFYGGYKKLAASGDLKDIETLTGKASFDPFLEKAMDILRQHKANLECIADVTRVALGRQEDRTIGILPNGWNGSMLVERPQLLACLRCADVPASDPK
jgi:hypothetical protein